MTGELKLRVSFARVTVTASHHNPSILTPDFLSAAGIVPGHWKIAKAEWSPEFSSILYHNGVLWTMDQDRLAIEDDRTSEFSEAYEIHALARLYLEKVRVVPYRNTFLNFEAWTPRDHPGDWLTQRFLNPSITDDQPDDLVLEPRFVFNMPGGLVRLWMTRGTHVADSGPEQDGINIRIGAFYRGPMDSEELVSAISRWPADREKVLGVVNHLLGGDLECQM